MSVLFVDLVGFTALSEGREAEDVRELLGRYFELAKQVVGRYGGGIQKFIGDAVMAVWGAPVAREDDAERSVRAALELVDGVAAFGAEVGAPDLRARAGVVSGHVAALERIDEGIVVGDRVNTASRVQSAAAPGTVLVDEVTRQMCSAVIAFEDAGKHVVKGKAEPLHLWRAIKVLASSGGRDRQQMIEAPLMGREGELRLLKEALHGSVALGSVRLVVISGEAGVGKSRLRQELSTYIDGLADTFRWHSGRCLSHGDGVAFWALGEIVRQRFGIAEDASSGEIARKLELGLQEWVSDPADREYLRPRLGALLGVAGPGFERAELFGGWRLFFERLAERDPVVLVFEDMQYADQGLLDFIDQLLEWSVHCPIFILALARPELADRREGWPEGRRNATVIELEPLEEASIRSMIEAVVDELPGEAMGRIVAQAQGIPLYAIETLRALTDRGTLQPVDGRLVASGDLGELEVPASLTALLSARLDALTADERTVIKAIALFGDTFPRDAASALSELDAERLDPALLGLVRKQVLAVIADPLSPDRGQYAFVQGLLRTVAQGLLSRRERKRLHLAAAEHLRGAFANEGEEVAEIIATHLLAALQATRETDPDMPDLRARAAAALRRAGARAGTVGAPQVAHSSYMQAAELAEEQHRPALIQAAGEMLLQAGRREDAVALLDQAADEYTRIGQVREAAMTAVPAARALLRLGRLREAAERATRALATFDRTDEINADVAQLSSVLGGAHTHAGEYEQAALVLERALVTAEALELPDVLALALNTKASMYTYLGRPQEAGGLFALMGQVAQRHRLDEALKIAQGNLANLGLVWDLPDASTYTEAALAICRRRGDRYAESHAANLLARMHLYSGRWQQLAQLCDELIEPDPNRPGAEFVHHARLLLHTHRGQGEQAAAALEYLTAWRDSDHIEYTAAYAACVISTRFAQDDPTAALDIALHTLPESINSLTPASEGVRDGWPPGLQAALRLGRHQDARTLIALLAERPRGHVPPYLRAHLARAQALLDSAEGQHETVEHDLTGAIDQFANLAYPFWQAVTQSDLAAWLTDHGRADEAQPLVERAIAALTTLEVTPALDRVTELRRHASAHHLLADPRI